MNSHVTSHAQVATDPMSYMQVLLLPVPWDGAVAIHTHGAIRHVGSVGAVHRSR